MWKIVLPLESSNSEGVFFLNVSCCLVKRSSAGDVVIQIVKLCINNCLLGSVRGRTLAGLSVSWMCRDELCLWEFSSVGKEWGGVAEKWGRGSLVHQQPAVQLWRELVVQPCVFDCWSLILSSWGVKLGANLLQLTLQSMKSLEAFLKDRLLKSLKLMR